MFKNCVECVSSAKTVCQNRNSAEWIFWGPDNLCSLLVLGDRNPKICIPLIHVTRVAPKQLSITKWNGLLDIGHNNANRKGGQILTFWKTVKRRCCGTNARVGEPRSTDSAHFPIAENDLQLHPLLVFILLHFSCWLAFHSCMQLSPAVAEPVTVVTRSDAAKHDAGRQCFLWPAFLRCGCKIACDFLGHSWVLWIPMTSPHCFITIKSTNVMSHGENILP